MKNIPAKTLWVLEWQPGDLSPAITQYELIQIWFQGDAGRAARVRTKKGTKTIRETYGRRRFFTEAEGVRQYCQGFIEEGCKRLRRQLESLEALLAVSPLSLSATIVPPSLPGPFTNREN